MRGLGGLKCKCCGVSDSAAAVQDLTGLLKVGEEVCPCMCVCAGGGGGRAGGGGGGWRGAKRF